jgi:signal transduction histidine kinase
VFDGGALRTLAVAASPAPQAQREDARQRELSLYGVTCFAEDSVGTIWLANPGNLFRVENDRCVPVLWSLRAEGGSERREPITGVTCLYAAAPSHSPGEGESRRQRDLWIYSADLGLLCWRDERITPVPFGGAPVLGMTEDGLGYYWMLTRRGIVRSRLPSSAKPRELAFGLGDGIPSVEGASGRQPVCARDTDGRLWFATRKGVASIDPAGLRPNPVAPSVHFEALVYRLLRGGVEVETRVALDFHPAMRSPIVVPAGARRLEFFFSAPSFSAPEKMRFAMQLHASLKPRPDSAPWLDAGPRRVIELFERPPGDFTLLVRAANDDGVWSSVPAAIAFTVAPFYWQRMSFRIAAGFALAAAGGAVVWLLTRARWRGAVERERAAQEMRDLAGRLIGAQEVERTRIARELHDGLSQSVALMSVHFDLLAQHPPDTADFSENMRDLSGQAQRISSEMHRISHELHPAKLEQLGLVPALRGFCRDIAAAHGLAVEFTHDDIPDTLPAGVDICLYRVVQESLHNVIKHAKAARANVRLTTVEKTIRLAVTDDGAGFDSTAPPAKSSLGLVSMKERVRLVDGTLTVESQQGKGTTVALAVAL